MCQAARSCRHDEGYFDEASRAGASLSIAGERPQIDVAAEYLERKARRQRLRRDGRALMTGRGWRNNPTAIRAVADMATLRPRGSFGRTNPMRSVLSVLALLAALSVDAAHAQSAATASSGGEGSAASGGSESTEEIVVRGRRLADFRVELEKARVRAYDIFNEINTGDDFDVHCVLEESTGTRMRQQVCRARFEGRISSRAAQEYISALRWSCPDGLTADCIFSDRSAAGISAAAAVESEAPAKRDLLNQEIHRLAREDLRFAQAIVDWYDANLRYEEERKRSRERTRER
jgi:hypothetical protein